jgi:hypothetical protein
LAFFGAFFGGRFGWSGGGAITATIWDGACGGKRASGHLLPLAPLF